MSIRLVLVAAFVTALSCSAGCRQGVPSRVQRASAETALLARLERTECFGSCPVYVVEIARDGSVRYEGRAYVLTKRSAARSLRPAQLDLLRAAFARARFDQLAEKCCDCSDATDFPSAVVTFADGGSPKTIRDYHGCRKTPKELRALEDDIDAIVEIEKWIGTPDQRKLCCASP